MGRLFGTDGVRGIANIELTCELAMKIGRGTALVLSEDCKRPKVMIGADTRISSDMLVASVSAGLCSVGADVLLLGVVPTPAVAFLVREYKYDAGIMISASHNPCEYNGIKIFKSDGYKLSDSTEEEMESFILDDTAILPQKISADVGRKICSDDAVSDYIEHLAKTVDCDFYGMCIAVDCANGSSSVTAPKLFEKLGFDCHIISAEPDGININSNCGSMHPEKLSRYVKSHPECQAGFAFDGDADRLICVDENGELVDGDKIMSICAQALKAESRLKNNTIVSTVMSNMGLFRFCEDNNIGCVKTKVGDRYVLEKMLECGYNFGGEQSGHVIFLDYSTTGDGQLTALQILSVMKKSGKKLSFLSNEMKVYPQVIKNVKVSQMGKVRFEYDTVIKNAINKAEKELDSRGRVLVRVSGTEPLVRVMLEGEKEELIERLAEEIALVVEERLM